MPQEPVLTSEPRWPDILALLSIGCLHYVLPPELRIGPGWLVLMMVTALTIPGMIFHHRRDWWRSHVLGWVVNSVVTLLVGISLGLLVWRLPTHKEHAEAVVTLGCHTLELQHLDFRLLVLEVGCRRTRSAGLA